MSTPPLIFGPIPPYNNPPINPQYYNPSRFVISNVTLGYPTIITTTQNMNYVIGQLVRLIIPPSFGCYQLNEMTGYVVTIPAANQVGITINSTKNVDPYIASSATTVAQIIPVGDINNGTVNTQGRINQATAIPGSFIDVSPI